MNLSVQGKPVIQCLKSASCIPANRKIYLVATVALSGLIALLIVGYGMHRSVNRLDATESAPLSKSDDGQDLGELGGTPALASSSGDEPVESLESEEKSPHLEVSSSPESVCASSPKMTQALHSAIRTGDQGRVRELIEQGADVNALGKKGAALHVAVFSAMDTLPLTKCLSVWKTGLPKWKAKWFAIVNELVQRGADPSIKNESNQTVRESINDPLFDSPYCFYTSSSKKLSDLSNGRKLVHEILDDAEACLINPRFRMFLLCANAHEQTGGPLGMLPVELVCIIKNQMGIKNVLRNYRPASARDECA